MEPISVLVTDDHTLFRKGNMRLLETFDEVGDIFEASNGEEALAILKEEKIDLILLDLEMPVVDGWETARRVTDLYPDIYIIMISMYDNLKIISDLIEIGVHSYLLKSAEPEEVHRAMTSVLDNQFYYNQLVSKALHNKIKGQSSVETGILTKREVEIVRLICQELTMKEISERLFLSEQTVLTHRKNLMKKMNARNSVSIVRYAIQNGIIHL